MGFPTNDQKNKGTQNLGRWALAVRLFARPGKIARLESRERHRLTKALEGVPTAVQSKRAA